VHIAATSRVLTRTLLVLGLIVLNGLALGPAAAQDGAVDCADWASETLQIMAPSGTGGGWDTTARELARTMQEEGIVETVEVFNVEGGTGTVGLAELINTHEGDGHMLMMTGLAMVGGIELNASPVRLEQSTPIALLTTEFEVIVVPADSEIESFDQLMQMFKDDPGSVAWGGGSAGGADHIMLGLIAEAVGVDPTQLNYVPFSGGGEALSAILGGQVTAGVSGLGEWIDQIESGELRALAVSGRADVASDATPMAGEASPAAGVGSDIPTLQDQGVDVEFANWRGIVAPPGLSEEDTACLSQAVEQAVNSATWADTLEQFGWTAYYSGGDEAAAYMASEAERVQEILVNLQLIEGE
jgi:putative tricarboxylic transport membrane protein